VRRDRAFDRLLLDHVGPVVEPRPFFRRTPSRVPLGGRGDQSSQNLRRRALERACFIDAVLRPGDEITEEARAEAALSRLPLNLSEISARGPRRIAVEFGVSVGANDCDLGPRAVLAPHPIGEAREEIEALTLRRRYMAARPPAPIKGEGERRITLDRHRGGALQLLKIVGLFALESPGIE
jgi:hypothetical protein